MTYRPDIDGLRAIAVLAIILFHTGIGGFSGGFTGVDIFFVISGYLITGILMRDLEAGEFSLIRFYERRIRRILPALVFVCVMSAILSWFILLPDDLERFFNSLVASLLFYSNIWFWMHTGYFEEAAIDQPLLHMWTLAVEAHFYVICPLLLWGLYRWHARYMAFWLGGICIISFLLSVYGVNYVQSAAFYLLPMRLWEFGLGAILALMPVQRILFNKIVLEIFAAIGLVLIFWGLFMLNKDSLFPGYNALFPCLGAAIVILTGHQNKTLVSRLLSFYPFVFIGLISYSLYLWHWPFMTLWHYVYLAPFSINVSGALIVFSMLCATASWKWIEQPFRSSSHLFSRKAVFVYSGGSVVLLCAVASIFMLQARFGMHHSDLGVGVEKDIISEVFNADPSMFNQSSYGSYETELRLLSYQRFDVETEYRAGSCFIGQEDQFSDFNPDLCMSLDPQRKNYVLIGDSHAAHYWPGLRKNFPDVNFLQATAGHCVSLVDMTSSDTDRCRQMNQYVLSEFIPAHFSEIDGMILSGRWSEEMISSLDRTLFYLKQYSLNIILIGPGPHYSRNVPKLLLYEIGNEKKDPFFQFRDQQDIKIDHTLESLAQQHNVHYISAYQSLCPKQDEGCIMSLAPGIPVQWDDSHLTREASEWIVNEWKQRKLLPF